MKFTLLTSSAIALTTLIPSISAHAFIYWAAGDADPSVHGWALGYRTTTPANGQGQLPFQRDVAVFSNPAVPCKKGKWRKTCEHREYLRTGCGISLFSINRYHESYSPNKDKPYKKSGGKKNEWYYMTKYVSNKPFIPIVSEVQKMVNSNSLPQVSTGGYLVMKIHQINADGAGPYECFIDYSGSAGQWTRKLAVQWQVKFTGKKSTNNYGSLKNQQLRVKLPDDMNCSGSYGGKNNICMVRCQNSAPNGPFGGCVPIQQAQAPEEAQDEIPNQETPDPPPQTNQNDADDYNGADNVQESYDYSY
ncbi:hypothetical protein TWF481_001637 [Arthrobotrys musiformis]|uniref:Uncharacterized protein n=1 Tax=Arthrobotrys musiformis TaxID=47236 RepID=A0AAV9VVP6_9PEZI